MIHTNVMHYDVLNYHNTIAIGGNHIVAVDRNRTSIYTWGKNESGQLGNGTISQDSTSVPYFIGELNTKSKQIEQFLFFFVDVRGIGYIFHFRGILTVAVVAVETIFTQATARFVTGAVAIAAIDFCATQRRSGWRLQSLQTFFNM